jgi:hypothetical protein
VEIIESRFSFRAVGCVPIPTHTAHAQRWPRLTCSIRLEAEKNDAFGRWPGIPSVLISIVAEENVWLFLLCRHPLPDVEAWTILMPSVPGSEGN